jgi:hypothetical protein
MYQQMDHWVLLYQDAIAQVWGRRSTYDNPQHPAWLPLKDRVVHNRRATDSVTWPAIQRSRPANRLISAPFPCFYFQACNP